MTDLAWQMLGLGFAVGILAGGFADGWLYRRILIGKANPQFRTAEKIGDGFYYIVPEGEYNVLKVHARMGINRGEIL